MYTHCANHTTPQPNTNFASLTPASDLNDLHHVPGSGLLLSANEGIQMGAYFVPQLGPAPRWASFLENMTEELEDGGAAARGVYEDFKFVSREELTQYVSSLPFTSSCRRLSICHL